MRAIPTRSVSAAIIVIPLADGGALADLVRDTFAGER